MSSAKDRRPMQIVGLTFQVAEAAGALLEAHGPCDDAEEGNDVYPECLDVGCKYCTLSRAHTAWNREMTRG